MQKETNALRDKDFDYPPNKRPPFLKLGVAKPFEMPFGQIVSSHSVIPGFYMVRDRRKLEILAKMTRLDENNVSELRECIEGENTENAFVPVKLVSVAKDVPQRFARIYVVPEALKGSELGEEIKHSSPLPESKCVKECFEIPMDAISKCFW